MILFDTFIVLKNIKTLVCSSDVLNLWQQNSKFHHR
jgi:hypothetical protein